MAKSAILRGRMAADVRIQGTDVDAAGLVERGRDGTLTVRTCISVFRRELLAPVLDDSGSQSARRGQRRDLRSDAAQRIHRKRERQRTLERSGRDAARPRRVSQTSSANSAAEPTGGIAGSAHDDGSGNLAVNATFRAGVSGFDAQASLSARNDDAQVRETLRHVGEPQADGSSKLVIHGQMFKLY